MCTQCSSSSHVCMDCPPTCENPLFRQVPKPSHRPTKQNSLDSRFLCVDTLVNQTGFMRLSMHTLVWGLHWGEIICSVYCKKYQKKTLKFACHLNPNISSPKTMSLIVHYLYGIFFFNKFTLASPSAKDRQMNILPSKIGLSLNHSFPESFPLRKIKDFNLKN